MTVIFYLKLNRYQNGTHFSLPNIINPMCLQYLIEVIFLPIQNTV